MHPKGQSEQWGSRVEGWMQALHSLLRGGRPAGHVLAPLNILPHHHHLHTQHINPTPHPTPPPPTRCPAALVPHHPAFFLEQALPFLLPLCTDGVLEARHGAVAALAELLPALRCDGLPTELRRWQVLSLDSHLLLRLKYLKPPPWKTTASPPQQAGGRHDAAGAGGGNGRGGPRH